MNGAVAGYWMLMVLGSTPHHIISYREFYNTYDWCVSRKAELETAKPKPGVTMACVRANIEEWQYAPQQPRPKVIKP